MKKHTHTHTPHESCEVSFFHNLLQQKSVTFPPPPNKKWRSPTMYFMFLFWSRSKCRDLQREGHHRCPRDRGSDGEETASASIGTKK